MLRTYMQFSPQFQQRYIPEGVGAVPAQIPELLRGQSRTMVAGHVGLGGALGVVLLEIHDFYLLRRLFRPEVVAGVGEILENEARVVAKARNIAASMRLADAASDEDSGPGSGDDVDALDEEVA